MKRLWHHIGNVILIGAIPVIAFWAAIALGFLFYPEDVDGASNLVMVFVGTGCLVAIFLLVLNIRRGIREFFDK